MPPAPSLPSRPTAPPDESSVGRYGAGLAALLERTDAQATYVAARSQAVQGRYERHVARAALGLATGTVHAAAGP